MAGTEQLNKSVTSLSELAVKLFEATLTDAKNAQQLEHLRDCKIQIHNLQEAVENEMFYKALSEVQEQLNINIEILEKLLLPEISPTKKVKHDGECGKILETIKETQVVPKVNSFDEIAGLQNIKFTLERLLILPIKQPQLYTNLDFGNCILLYGPPGTGKTKIVHALASEAKVKLHCVAASTILSSYVGQTEKMLRELFCYMRTPGGKILFIDEIDGLCRKRTQNEFEHTRRLKTELMTQLTNFGGQRNSFLICATNCPWDIDHAFMRRFQEKLYFPLPNYEQRLDLLKLYTKNTTLEQTCQAWEAILTGTQGFSGSDLNDLVQHALTMPIIRLQKTRVWIKLGDMYKSINFNSDFKFDSSAEYVFCNLRDLPANSVLMDQGDVSDLYKALKLVKKTVSETEIQRYNDFL